MCVCVCVYVCMYKLFNIIYIYIYIYIYTLIIERNQKYVMGESWRRHDMILVYDSMMGLAKQCDDGIQVLQSINCC